jgi:hypothetical protein
MAQEEEDMNIETPPVPSLPIDVDDESENMDCERNFDRESVEHISGEVNGIEPRT